MQFADDEMMIFTNFKFGFSASPIQHGLAQVCDIHRKRPHPRASTTRSARVVFTGTTLAPYGETSTVGPKATIHQVSN
jgi:hypothetical protein